MADDKDKQLGQLTKISDKALTYDTQRQFNWMRMKNNERWWKKTAWRERVSVLNTRVRQYALAQIDQIFIYKASVLHILHLSLLVTASGHNLFL